MFGCYENHLFFSFLYIKMNDQYSRLIAVNDSPKRSTQQRK